MLFISTCLLLLTSDSDSADVRNPPCDGVFVLYNSIGVLMRRCADVLAHVHMCLQMCLLSRCAEMRMCRCVLKCRRDHSKLTSVS